MLSNREQTLLATLNEERLVGLCRKLITIPTVNLYSGDKAPAGEKAGLDYMAELFRSMGAQVTRIPCDDAAFDKYNVLATKGRISEGRDNVVATFTFGDGNGPTVLMDAHMDTVAVDHYIGEPFAAELKDGLIYGRGSSDDKGGVSTMTEAARMLLASPEGLNGKLVCCVVSEEECDGAGRGSISCVAHLPKPDYAMVIDGGYGQVTDGCCGVVTARITVPGRAGHAANGAINAIEQALKLVPAFETFRNMRGNRPGTMNFGLFQAGDHPANVPNLATLAFNIKTNLQDMAAAKEKYGVDNGRLVRELFERCVFAIVDKDSSFEGLRPTITWTKDMPATLASALDPAFVEEFRAAYEDATGINPPVAPMQGWGDLAHFLRAGVSTVGLGAGAGCAHAATEFTKVENLVGTARIAALAAFRKLSR